MANALERAALLDCLVTGGCFSVNGLQRLDRLGLGDSWARRPPAPVSSSRLRRVWWADLRRFASRFVNSNCFKKGDAAFAQIDHAAALLMSSRTGAVLAREDCCLESFRMAQLYGRARVYLLPTAHYATVWRLMRREAEEFPEAFRPEEIEQDFAAERVERKEQELKAASLILCPSKFVQESVRTAGVEPARIVLMPFGSSAPAGEIANVTRERVFLYAGKVSARKGVHRLVRVWKRLGAYRTHRLRLIGDMALPARFAAGYRGVFEHVPRMVRERLAVEYSKAQAFVFNAMADGFGHVFAEAMACGTPVLASWNCGAPDLIDDGVEGKLFEYGDDEALGTALDWALTHPRELEQMGAAALERARQCTWEQFVERFLHSVRGVLNAVAPISAVAGHCSASVSRLERAND